MRHLILFYLIGFTTISTQVLADEFPRLPSGKPDFSGLWTSATLTPLERPDQIAENTRLSEEQRIAMEQAADARYEALAGAPPPGSVGGYNREWLDPGMKALADGRSALIINPADGKIPWKAAAKAKSDADRARYGVGPFNTFADMDTGERCLSDGVTMAPLQPYNMNYQIFHTEDALAINHEMYHEYRIIPLDGRPFIPDNIGQWLGDARGVWDGDTLIVTSKVFAEKSHYYWAWPWRAARRNLTITETFTPISPGNIDYRFTVEDPDMFTQAWTAAAPLTTDQASRGVTTGPLFEFACHEGNYALPNILRGARMQEQEAHKATQSSGE